MKEKYKKKGNLTLNLSNQTAAPRSTLIFFSPKPVVQALSPWLGIFLLHTISNFFFPQPHTRQKPELPFSSHSPQNHFSFSQPTLTTPSPAFTDYPLQTRTRTSTSTNSTTPRFSLRPHKSASLFPLHRFPLHFLFSVDPSVFPNQRAFTLPFHFSVVHTVSHQCRPQIGLQQQPFSSSTSTGAVPSSSARATHLLQPTATARSSCSSACLL